ncbi:MAG: ferritin-like domain-containing protein [Gammaproteobacteria bacterium]
MTNLYDAALQCLLERDADRKIQLTHDFATRWRAGELSLDGAESGVERLEYPGRPDTPELVDPAKVPRRGMRNLAERMALIHSLAHIEFNAVNLGWDAVYRFRDLPKRYYDDWVQVADDEAKHFIALRQRLRDNGSDYGQFQAHNGLWEMALKTDTDFTARMALVPRVLEARSLDVVPRINQKLASVGDHETVAVLEMIEREEVAHVAAGSRWFEYSCEQLGLEPRSTFRQLVEQFMGVRLKGPFNREAHNRAGFSFDELDELETWGA